MTGTGHHSGTKADPRPRRVCEIRPEDRPRLLFPPCLPQRRPAHSLQDVGHRCTPSRRLRCRCAGLVVDVTPPAASAADVAPPSTSATDVAPSLDSAVDVVPPPAFAFIITPPLSPPSPLLPPLAPSSPSLPPLSPPSSSLPLSSPGLLRSPE